MAGVTEGELGRAGDRLHVGRHQPERRAFLTESFRVERTADMAGRHHKGLSMRVRVQDSINGQEKP
jgi:hypothetical protein